MNKVIAFLLSISLAFSFPACQAPAASGSASSVSSTSASQQAHQTTDPSGANGEIALWNRSTLLCCSTAAGPAFEGAGLTIGMPGRDGAVDHVMVKNGALHAHVLGDTEAVGICGSGVVDALACLLETGQMDETGFLDPEPAVICGRVALPQKDVRAVQLGKSAVAAGIRTLTTTAGLTFSQVDELAIAGGFGSYLDVNNAGRIGLIPEELVPKVRILGNAALQGASMLLLDQPKIPDCEAMTRQARTVDLASNPLFLQAYTDGMFFECDDLPATACRAYFTWSTSR